MATLGPDKAREVLARLKAVLVEMPFQFLRRVDPQMVLSFLQDEHPQTITLVLAHMDAKQAAAGPQRAARAGPGRHRPPARGHGPHLARHRQAGRVLPAAAALHGAAAQRVRAGRWPAAARRHHQPQRPQHRAADPRGPRAAQHRARRGGAGAHVHVRGHHASSRTARCSCCCAPSTPRTWPSRSRASRRTSATSSSRTCPSGPASRLVEDMDVLGPVRVKQVEEAQAAIIRQIRVLEESGDIVDLAGEPAMTSSSERPAQPSSCAAVRRPAPRARHGSPPTCAPARSWAGSAPTRAWSTRRSRPSSPRPSAGPRDAGWQQGHRDGYDAGRCRGRRRRRRGGAGAPGARGRGGRDARAPVVRRARAAAAGRRRAGRARGPGPGGASTGRSPTWRWRIAEALVGRHLELAAAPALDAVHRALALLPRQAAVTVRRAPRRRRDPARPLDRPGRRQRRPRRRPRGRGRRLRRRGRRPHRRRPARHGARAPAGGAGPVTASSRGRWPPPRRTRCGRLLHAAAPTVTGRVTSAVGPQRRRRRARPRRRRGRQPRRRRRADPRRGGRAARRRPPPACPSRTCAAYGGAAGSCATGGPLTVPIGPGLLGRVVDALGRPIDGGPPLRDVVPDRCRGRPPDRHEPGPDRHADGPGRARPRHARAVRTRPAHRHLRRLGRRQVEHAVDDHPRHRRADLRARAGG